MDTLQLSVAPAPEESGGGFQVLVFVNDAELTEAGAGLGMDPYDVLIPVNKFLPAPSPKAFGVARCGCGVYGCGATNITITEEAERIVWTWSVEKPVDRSMFDRATYLAEVARIAADHSWETPERTAGRLILTQVNREQLSALGLSVSWVANDWREPALFKVCLTLDQAYQLFLRFPWDGSSPEHLAERVLGTLNDPAAPPRWQATWHGMAPEHTNVPPRLANADWARERI